MGTTTVEFDSPFWLPGWVTRDEDEFRALVTDQSARDHWVADGNYSAVRDILWARATTLIWLDYPFVFVRWRSSKRTIHRSVNGDTVCNGNREYLSKAFFSRDSILLWVVATHHRNRERYHAIVEGDGYPDLAKIRLKSPAQTATFLGGVKPI